MTPSMPTAIEISKIKNNYHGLLVKKSPNCVSLITDEVWWKLLPLYFAIHKMSQGQCEPIIPRVNLLFSNMPTNENINSLEIWRQNWHSHPKDFHGMPLTKQYSILTADWCHLSAVIFHAPTRRNYLFRVEASFLSKSDEGNRYRHMPRAMMSQTTMAAPRFSSEQTVTGGAIYKLDNICKYTWEVDIFF